MSAVDVIRQRIKEAADRGVFQGFRESAGRMGKTVFTFRWLLGTEFCLVVDPNKQELTVKDLLPAIDRYSFIDSDLRRFIADRGDPKLPAHRRIDSAVGALSYTNRKQQVSLMMRVQKNQYQQAIKMLLVSLNDLFSHLHLYHIDYLQQNFGVAEE